MVRISEEFSLKRHGSESHKCRKLDIVSCIHFLTYSCSIVKEVALTSSALESEELSFSFF